MYTPGDSLSNQVWSGGGTEDVIVNSEMTARETAPQIAINYNGSWCSGTLVRSDVVLTAAHCVVDETGAAYGSTADLKVCTKGNWHDADPACTNSEDFYFNPAYDVTSSFRPKNDWALIRLQDSIGSTTRTMFFSQASSSTTRNADITLGGYPGMWRSDSACIANWKVANSADISSMRGTRLHLAAGETSTIHTKSLVLNITHGDGYTITGLKLIRFVDSM